MYNKKGEDSNKIKEDKNIKQNISHKEEFNENIENYNEYFGQKITDLQNQLKCHLLHHLESCRYSLRT